MTEFTEGRTMKCEYCGRSYFEPEGKMCDCWKCSNCGGWFEDLGDCANTEKWLCVYCEDERLQGES
jgi:hypothetical protein